MRDRAYLAAHFSHADAGAQHLAEELGIRESRFDDVEEDDVRFDGFEIECDGRSFPVLGRVSEDSPFAARIPPEALPASQALRSDVLAELHSVETNLLHSPVRIVDRQP